jgi:hypothetical protein
VALIVTPGPEPARRGETALVPLGTRAAAQIAAGSTS